ncbi:hypothetical protein [Ideonella sp. A 288]|uniref:hypothetical protein n=1 Tax=Ideonella sp. A 288 TaxID=1962181 RepID=UPI001185768E|nr:hypothetical protein [Ideonella sp. A 288]
MKTFPSTLKRRSICVAASAALLCIAAMPTPAQVTATSFQAWSVDTNGSLSFRPLPCSGVDDQPVIGGCPGAGVGRRPPVDDRIDTCCLSDVVCRRSLSQRRCGCVDNIVVKPGAVTVRPCVRVNALGMDRSCVCQHITL